MLNYSPYLDDDYYYASPYLSRRELLRRHEMERRRRAEMEYQQRLEAMQRRREQEYRRRQYEAWRRQQEEDELMRQKMLHQQQRVHPEEGMLVRGPDGRLYRLVRDEIPEMEMEEPPKVKVPRVKKSIPIKVAPPSSSSMDEESVEDAQPRVIVSKKTKPRRTKRVTVLVEDASDSENEDESHSIWRNRRPSPGQWMEPIEEYY